MPARPQSSRRAALRLGAALGLAGAAGPALGGCDVVGDVLGDDDPAAGASEQEPRPASPEDPADDALAASAAAAIGEAYAVVLAARRAQPRLRAELTPWLRLHRAHAVELGGLPDVAPVGVPGSRAGARAAVTTVEQRLQRRLATAAANAESGAFAALLASMAAGVAQRLAVEEGA